MAEITSSSSPSAKAAQLTVAEMLEWFRAQPPDRVYVRSNAHNCPVASAMRAALGGTEVDCRTKRVYTVADDDDGTALQEDVALLIRTFDTTSISLVVERDEAIAAAENVLARQKELS